VNPRREQARRRRRSAFLGGLLLALALSWGCGRGAAPAESMNLVLISLDTLKPERMSLYGNERETTPAIDALAERGVVFGRASSPSPWTLPAHAAMLTGRYPSSLTVDPNDRRIFHAAPLLSHLFAEAGYQTAAVTAGGFVSESFGANRGFESFAFSGPGRAVRFIEEEAAEPFFLFFHTYAAHAPYKHRRFVKGLPGGRLQNVYDEGGKGLHAQLVRGGFEPTAAEREFLLALYDGGVAAADQMVGAILDALERSGVADRTVVIVTSDHGEELWGHTGRAAYHGHTLYDELLHVPLVWFEPGLDSGGDRVSERVSLVDIVPTVVSRFGLQAEGPYDGVDLSPLLEKRKLTGERLIFGEAVRHGPARTSVQSARGKLIEVEDRKQRGEGAFYPVPVGSERELFLADDPTEAQDRYEERPDVASRLAAALESHRSARAAAEAPEVEIDLDEATRERLEALGYTE